ncbi:hypothetical protein CEP52_008543 [Fusarium oligoseptatum]|uniref:Tubulin-folding cofactor D C-terminal domain-containing protein n=1 Tax=Fusarium oligoseptatum TaxID=2604345 RepID=A0A428THC7_9HYPO|nr:hypothetical protein CEP52_008543 [Fusarium oligoseptatum]
MDSYCASQQFLDKFPALAAAGTVNLDSSLIHQILATVSTVLEDLQATAYRKPELLAEAASRLVVSTLPILQVALLGIKSEEALRPGQELLHPDNSSSYLSLVSALDSHDGTADEHVLRLTSSLRSIVPTWLNRNEQETVEPAAAASLVLLIFSGPTERKTILDEWAETVKHRPTSRTTVHGNGYFHALTIAQPLSELSEDVASKALLERWEWDTEVESRVAILQSLTQSRILRDKPMIFLDLIAEGLNDYTTNARGDVGSHGILFGPFFFSTLRLSAEKLDRVRPEAQAAIALVLKEGDATQFRKLTFSSKIYFQNLLNLHLMAGFVTSADTGNEDLVIASRAALCEFCESSQENLELVCQALLQNLKTRQGQDRVIVPTLEITAFLFHVKLFQGSAVNFRSLCLQTQKAGYKTGNVRKLEACIRVYSGVASMGDQEGAEAGVQEARKRLGALLYHPWPKVRSMVVDGLWGLVGDQEEAGERLKGVDWGRAGKEQIKTAVEELQLV